ncbi:MAG: beta-N-acetylhexosaminidase [Gemmatimonadota bacterium]|nr:beta-N-acetylhexosaminidase [Gemmatimonadota bacterium]
MGLGRNVLLLGTAIMMTACEPGPVLSVIPVPKQVEAARGSFTLDAGVGIGLADASDASLREIAELWAVPFRRGAALPFPIGSEGDIRLAVEPEATGVGAEGYRLDVRSDGISVVGTDHAGVFYGLQTLSQLMPPGTEAGIGSTSEGVEIAAVSIVDEPRFAYRGMHLDVARHFFDPDFVKRYLDLLARYKINRFHWHLTEDQGWRIEIDAYPRLMEIAAYRDETQIGHGSEEFRGDGERHGGYYTKEEIRDIVAYAKARHITVIPEIEMPGHAQAALAAYPELACTEGPFEVAKTWGVFEDIYCPYEETFVFLETVLTEVIELFPGEYIHIGGDEAPKTRWEESEYVENLMQRLGFNDVEQVQGWFIRRIERFLNDKGKRIIGWDEILEGGIAPNATVGSWRGVLGGIEASRMGHDVIMTPYSHLYFDYYQSEDRENEPFAIGGFLPLDTVYSYEPIPGPLRARDASRIIGAQANMWTEYMKTPEHVEYMLLPRMLALAEVVWSPAEKKGYEAFLGRLQWHLRRFDALGVNYRPPDR